MSPVTTRERENKHQKMDGNRQVQCPRCGCSLKKKKLQAHLQNHERSENAVLH